MALSLSRPVNKGGRPTRKMRRTYFSDCMHNRCFHTGCRCKIWPHSQRSVRPGVQAGYGPVAHTPCQPRMVTMAGHTWWLWPATNGGYGRPRMVAMAGHEWWLWPATNGGYGWSRMVAMAGHEWWLWLVTNGGYGRPRMVAMAGHER